MFKKISLKDRFPPNGVKILFINEKESIAEYFILFPESNIYGLEQKYTHWLELVKN